MGELSTQWTGDCPGIMVAILDGELVIEQYMHCRHVSHLSPPVLTVFGVDSVLLAQWLYTYPRHYDSVQITRGYLDNMEGRML